MNVFSLAVVPGTAQERDLSSVFGMLVAPAAQFVKSWEAVSPRLGR
jgi:hypothetical protein